MTMATLAATIKVQIDLRYTPPSGPQIDTPRGQVDESTTYSIALGTSAGQANQLYAQTNTIGGGGTTDIDVASGLTDSLGGTVAIASEVAMVIIAAPSTNAALITVGGSAPANNWTAWFANPDDSEIIYPGGLSVLASPADGMATVVAGSADVLRFAGTAGDRFDLILLGR